MNKTIMKVFLIVALLVVIFLAWQLIFNENGILRTGYNKMADGINNQYKKVAGGDGEVIAKWDNKKNADDNGQGFDINTKKK